MNISLRKFNKTDIPFIMQNWVGANKVNPFFESANEEKLTEIFAMWEEEKLRNGNCHLVYCVLLDNRPVGLIGLTENIKEKFNLDLYIEDIYRGKGIGTQAFKLLENIAKQRGIATLTSSCTQANIASTNLHKKVGFNLIKAELSPNGTPMFRWQKDI